MEFSVQCPSCSSSYLDPYGRCPVCPYTTRGMPPTAPFNYPMTTMSYPMRYATPVVPTGLSLATQILMGISGLLALVGIGVGSYGYSVSRTLLDGGGTIQQENLATGVVALTLGAILLVNVVTAVLFIIWFFKSAQLSDILTPGRQSLSSGWAIAGWFVPLAYFVLPRIVMGGVWRASEPLSEAPQLLRRPRTLLVTAWWLTFCVGQSLWFMLSFVSPSQTYTHGIHFFTVAFVLMLITETMRAASAVLGVIMLRRVTTRQQIRTLQGPAQGNPYPAMPPGYGMPEPYAPQPYAPPAQQPPVAPPPAAPVQGYIPTQPQAAPPEAETAAPEAAAPEVAAPADAVPEDAIPAMPLDRPTVGLDKPGTD